MWGWSHRSKSTDDRRPEEKTSSVTFRSKSKDGTPNSPVNTRVVFTATGLEWLKATKAAVEKLQKMPDENFPDNQRSDYSKKMVREVINIINFVLKNNDFSEWIGFVINSAIQLNNLNNSFAVFDGNTKTYIPVVFNEESFQLINILLDQVKVFQYRIDLSEATIDHLKRNSSTLDEEEVINFVINALTYKSMLYKMLNENIVNVQQVEIINQAFARLNQYVTGEDFDIEEYRQQAIALLNNINKLPYFIFKVKKDVNFKNKDKPFTPDGEGFTIDFFRAGYLQQLLWLEVQLNYRLSQEEKTVHTKIRSMLQRNFAASDEIETIILGLYWDLKAYTNTDNFKSMLLLTHDDKLQIATELQARIEKIAHDGSSLPMPVKGIEVMKLVFEAAAKNERLVEKYEKEALQFSIGSLNLSIGKISIGNLGTMLAKAGYELFMACIIKLDHTNDDYLLQITEVTGAKIKRKFNPEPTEISATAENTSRPRMGR